MRTFGSAFFGLFALILTAVALPAAWIERNIISEEGFIDLAVPLGSNESFQEEMTTALAAEITGADGIPGGLAGLLEPIIAEAAAGVTELPGYPLAWEDTLRTSHALSFADTASLPLGADPSAAFTLDLAPIVALVAREVGGGMEIPAGDQALVNIGEPSHRAALERMETAAGMWRGMALAAAVGAVISLVLAHRRSTTSALLGLGLAVLGAAWFWITMLAPGIVAGTPAASPLAGVFAEGLTARSVESLGPLSLAVAGIGVVLLLAGGVVRIVSGPQRTG